MGSQFEDSCPDPSLCSMHLQLPWPLLRTQHDLSGSCAILLHKFTNIYLPAGSTGKTPTPNSATGQEQQMNKVATLTLQLQMMTQERNELRGILANYTNKDLNNR